MCLSELLLKYEYFFLITTLTNNNLAYFHATVPNFWRTEARQQLQTAIDNAPIVNKAKNVVLFLGDGMGVSTVTAARILAGQMNGQSGEEGFLSFEKFPFVALSKVYKYSLTK